MVGFVQNQLLADETIEHLRAVKIVKRLQIILPALALPLSYLLTEADQRVFQLLSRYLIAAHFCDGGIASACASQNTCCTT